jgi:2-C-methyl-D-erythritol 4-phosphate cytidylyltransferase
MPAPPPDPPATACAVVVAAGRGERFGVGDKVLCPLAGRPLLAHILDAIEAAPSLRDAIVVAGEHTRDAIEDLLVSGGWAKPLAIVVGGSRRQDSVANGVSATPEDAAVIAIHDGARPLVVPRLFELCVDAAALHGAAIAAIPVSDTIKRARGGLVEATVARDDLWTAQTPQAFRREVLLAALAHPIARELTFTDEAGLCEALGYPVAIVPGSRANMKVTVPEDLAIAEALLRSRPAPTG